LNGVISVTAFGPDKTAALALLDEAPASVTIPPMLRWSLVLAFLLIAPAVHASDYYSCTKKGAPSLGMTNVPDQIKYYKKKGYRCVLVMRSSRPKTARRRRNNKRNNKRSTTRYTSVPRRSTGPAGLRRTYEPLIQQAAKLYNIDANLVRAVIKVESNYHPRAISSAGAKGLMQLMPTISKELEVSDLFEPRQNIMAGTRYLRMLINQFKGNHKLVLAAYHAGPGIVSRRNAIPYKTTERYVRRVVSEWLRYRAAGL
jgi:hypothetical protein